MATYRSLMLFSLIATFASLLSVSAQLEVLVPGGPNLWWGMYAVLFWCEVLSLSAL